MYQAQQWSRGWARRVAMVGEAPTITSIDTNGEVCTAAWSGGSSVIHDLCSTTSEYTYRRHPMIDANPSGARDVRCYPCSDRVLQ